MSVRESDLLFYVTNNDDNTYSVFNRLTDTLILSEVTEDKVSAFLINNNPSHSFLEPPMTPGLYPASVDMAGASLCASSGWSSYPWDTLPSVAPTHEQMKLDFGDEKYLSKRISELADELLEKDITYILDDIDDCESKED